MNNLPTLRPIGRIKTLADIEKAFADVKYNFDLLTLQAPRLIITAPTAGTISFLVQEDDQTWHQWTFVAGAGVTITQDDVNRTLTFTSP